MNINKRTFLILILLCFVFGTLNSQNISGTVYELTNDNTKNPLPGTNVYWIGTVKGTATDKNGDFELSKKGITDFRLVISFVGYASDTLKINPQEAVPMTALERPPHLPHLVLGT